ncbi:AfsR/SARP family transcriptional regulator [Saccharothrix syringae]|uniref:Tetratricopeptide repeat protein n=1 Tax=Saccharothrix syringae TaxID=103733 RepID=A0A5Q0H5X6_SACSY|nr:BTAD domain-containing putative transcriptional regulator [Saccharothrix syringae]QFZ21315.1 tetratricopeptide repeat protein [Saccharothrix syringae]
MEFLVLGPLEVRSSGEVVRIPGVRQRRLLALLLLNANRVVPVDRLVDELWDEPPSSVRQQVHNAVTGLRKTLAAVPGDHALVRTDVGYRLDLPAGSLDADRFHALVRDAGRAEAGGRPAEAVRLLGAALELWRGDALAGVGGRAIANAAASLDEQRLTAVETLMSLRLGLGEAASVVADLRGLVADHPLRESLRGSLMLALHRSGRQAEALAAYEEGRRLLADELGLDPGAELRELHAAILDGSVAGPPRPPAGERTAFDRTALDRTALDRTALDRTAPNQAAPDQPAPDRAAPDRAALDQPALDRAALDRAAFERAALERAALHRVAPDRTAPEPPPVPGATPPPTAAAPGGARSPAEPSPKSYLPHDTADFSGRSAELVRLLAETRDALPTALVISAIDGMGGVGKTTLAVHLAHRIAEDYPDGQYFIDLHGFSPGVDPLTPAQALDALLRDSGVPPELVPSGVEGRSALWRSHLAGRRALLILDNAVDAAHVRPLLPGTAGVLVLVTSRRKLTALDGAVPMPLDVLPPDDAVALFTRVVGASRVAGQRKAVVRAVELCGRLPLAIRIAAARLRDRTTWTVADLVDRLGDQTRRRQFLQVDDRSVMSVIGLSYRYLPASRQRLFRLLSLHPGTDFDAYTAAALAGCSLDQAEYDLDALFDDNLLKQNTTGRFYFHDLVRDCAHQILADAEGEDQRRAALHRLFDYYLYAAHLWSSDLDNRVHPRPPEVDRPPAHVRPASSANHAVEILGVEHRNLLAVARYTAAHGWHRHAWQFACALQPMLRMRNYGEGSFELFEGGLRAAREAGSRRGESACLHGLAVVCRERRSADEARRYLRQALEIAAELGDRDAESAQLDELGGLYLVEDRLTEALEAFRTAEALTAHAPHTLLHASVTNSLGLVHRDLGQYDEALTYLGRALVMASRSSFPHAGPLTSWSIAAVHHYQGRHEEAVREFEGILRTSQESGFELGEAWALLGLCTARRCLGDLVESLDLGRRSLALARKLDLPRLECEVLDAIGEVTVALADLDQAHKVFAQAEEQSRRCGARRYEARAAEGFAHVALARGDRAEARRHWERALDLYPDGVADAEYARRHLLAPDGEATTCFRCAIARPVG